MRVGWYDGVTIITETDILRFDPHRQNNSNACNFISHAHGDHLSNSRLKGETYLTPETLDIAGALQSGCSENFIPFSLGDVVNVGGLEVVAHNAGHMLGSAQFEVHAADSTLVYSGDINCRDMFTTTAAESISCDVLVLETTYGIPFYNFPDLTQITAEIVGWSLAQIKAGKVPVFKTYSRGKAQEIIKIFNALTKVPVIAEGDAADVNDAYIKNGVNLEYVKSTTTEARELLKSNECICVSSTTHGLASLKNACTAIATGWALGRQYQGVQGAFPLSGHADFYQLIEYVRQARPKEVLTIHGFKAEFADYIKKKLDIKARPIPPINQRLLREYL